MLRDSGMLDPRDTPLCDGGVNGRNPSRLEDCDGRAFDCGSMFRLPEFSNPRLPELAFEGDDVAAEE
jgi:hypothetical protein